MKNYITAFILFTLTHSAFGQTMMHFADSIRTAYNIPELGYAVISSSAVIEMQILGVKRINTAIAAQPDDKFRIGSNTKAITCFIAAQLVKQGKISWHTKFFDLFPELKAKSNRAYRNLTLLNLLSFRTRLFPYTYTDSLPTKGQLTGNDAEQRYQFAEWFFKHKPVNTRDSINFSNLGYVAAGLMLEKASGKDYKELVQDLGNQLEIKFGFGAPNTMDTLQPWGHNKNLNPEQPGDNYKLNWLLAAGNINVSLPDYVKFIQLQLQGLSGQSQILNKNEFVFLHYGLSRFALGWFWLPGMDGRIYSYNIGNPGTFLSKVYVYKDADRAFILFSNAQTPKADEGLNVLYEVMKERYIR